MRCEVHPKTACCWCDGVSVRSGVCGLRGEILDLLMGPRHVSLLMSRDVKSSPVCSSCPGRTAGAQRAHSGLQHAKETICGETAPSAGHIQTHRGAPRPPETSPGTQTRLLSAPGRSHYDEQPCEGERERDKERQREDGGRSETFWVRMKSLKIRNIYKPLQTVSKQTQKQILPSFLPA